MMTAKNIRVNFRVNEEVYGIIDSMPGGSLSVKFENLVRAYRDEAPRLEKQKARLEKTIEEYRADLDDLKTKLGRASRVKEIVDTCIRDLEHRAKSPQGPAVL